VTATLVLRKDIDFRAEFGVRRNRARLRQDLTTLHILTADAADQRADVVASFAAIEQLAEHFNAGHGCLGGVLDADDFNFVAHVHNTSFDAAGNHRTTTRDREHVFDRHQERLVDRTVGLRNVLVHGFHQLENRILADLVVTAFKRSQSRTLHDRNVVAVEVII